MPCPIEGDAPGNKVDLEIVRAALRLREQMDVKAETACGACEFKGSCNFVNKSYSQVAGSTDSSSTAAKIQDVSTLLFGNYLQTL